MINIGNIAMNNMKIIISDMIENAKSGHPGSAISLVPLIFVLYTRILNFDPFDLTNFYRDRFILSNGHTCALLYTILFFMSNKYELNDLKNFRKLNSNTPGHPEYNEKMGIEFTTGPLGQGISNGVGVAISMKKLKLDNKVFVLCGDGCLMEGISYEATSLAGHLCLNNLILIYDDNNITIDGNTNLCFSENIRLRFEAINWNVLNINDGNKDILDIENKLNLAYSSKSKPTLIILKTTIGYETNLENSEKCHGSPLGINNLKDFKKKLGFNENIFFEINENVKNYFDKIKNEKSKIFKNNQKLILEPVNTFDKVSSYLKQINILKENISTRELSGIFLNKIVEYEKNIIIGSADLGGSNKTLIKNNEINKDNFSNVYLNYGVREHAMCGIANGISTLNILPIVSTFLQFINYCLASIRLSCLSNHKILYIFTHDSVFLGEDGPTHQPIEQLGILRSLPNMLVFRPCDKNELIGCYDYITKYNGPSSLILSRQNIPNIEGSFNEYVKYGGYILYKPDYFVDLILIATGSEIHLALNAAKKIDKLHIKVISMPCLELFEQQTDEYKNKIFDNCSNILVIEASNSQSWYKYTKHFYNINSFGKSGSLKDIQNYFCYTEEHLINYIENIFNI